MTTDNAGNTDEIQMTVTSDDDPETLDDQGGEIEDTPEPDDTTTDGMSQDQANDEAFTGICRGGPFDNQEKTVRSERGFLAYDKQRGIGYLYEWRNGSFMCTSPEGAPMDSAGRQRVADSGNYDILAVDDDPGDQA